MIIDKKLQLTGAAGQTVTATAVSTDVVDCLVDIGSSNSLYLVISNTTGITTTAAGAATVTFALQDSADNGTFADVFVTAAIPKATIVAGWQTVIPLPPGTRRYIRANFTVATGPLTGGNVFAANIVDGYQRNVAAPDAVNQPA